MYNLTFILCLILFWIIIMMFLGLLYVLDQIRELRRDILLIIMMREE